MDFLGLLFVSKMGFPILYYSLLSEISTNPPAEEV